MKKRNKISIVMGSESDLKIMNEAAQTLEEFGVDYEISVVSAHRTPEAMVEFAKKAEAKGIAAIIAGAGGAAHLPGMIASLTVLPVIGVPVQTTALKGLDSLLSIAQMPKGVPVATMAVDNAVNAALFAVRILGVSSEALRKKLLKTQDQQKKKVKDMNRRLKKK